MPCEFWRVNDRLLGSRARYGYAGVRDPRPNETAQIGAFEGFARYDLYSGAKTVHRFAAGETVCEPVFVAPPGSSRKDDGYVVSFVHEEGKPGGSFVLLDAQRLEAPPDCADQAAPARSGRPARKLDPSLALAPSRTLGAGDLEHVSYATRWILRSMPTRVQRFCSHTISA